MTNPHEVDVSKEDIANTNTGLTRESEEFFGVHSEEEDNMPRATTSRQPREEEKEKEVGNEVITLVIHTPRHLWGLGAAQFHFSVATTDAAFDVIDRMQENFEWMEKEFADRLATVASFENRITPAQIAKLEELAEEKGEELPDDFTDYSKTEASKLIQELMGKEEEPRRRSSSRRNGVKVGSARGVRTGSSSRRSTGGGSKRRGQYDNDRPGSATPKQQDFLKRLYREKGNRVPSDLEDMTFNEASEEITELKDALGYE